MRLELDLLVPTPLIARHPNVSVFLNGRLIGRFVCARENERRTFVVDAAQDRNNALLITTDQVVNPLREGFGTDNRDLGLQLRSYIWRTVG